LIQKKSESKEITYMEKRFFIWKDPGCAGVNVEWLELTGTEFHALLERPENKSRRFIRLGSGMDLDLDMIYLEVAETQYRDWAKEHNARKYRSRRDRDFSILSMDFSARDADVGSLHDVVPDDETDVENTALSHLAHEKLEKVLRELPAKDAKLLAEFYFMEKDAAEIARERGVSRSTVSRQISRLLGRLQKFF
jgi:RNA polymerase sigma factor (sigma-70 family)